jgi:hypothetical protein
MPRMYKGLLVALSLFMMAGAVNRAAAQPPQLDVPTVTVVKATPHTIWLQLTAGASGAPHGIYVEWMNSSDFALYGGWAPYGDPVLYYCGFSGAPSRHTGGLSTYALGPNQSVNVVVGDLFDETGVADNWSQELNPASAIVYHAHATGDGNNDSDSNNCGDHQDSSDSEKNSCTHSMGYWKTHQSVWPVSSLLLGTVSYTKAQLVSILNKPAGGNGLIILCHQLIATKLNIQNGADQSLVSSYVAAADAMIGALVCPPVGAGTLTPSSVETLADHLEDWNEGEMGPVTCGSTAASHSTWGQLKALYR